MITTTPTIAEDIERGIIIKALMAELKAELAAIEDRLEAAGLKGNQVPLENPHLEGRQFLANSECHVLPVRFESDLLAGSFDQGSPMHREAMAAAGDHFSRFFRQTDKFFRVQKEGEELRKLAREILEPEAYAGFVKAVTARNKDGIGRSRTVIAWDDVKPTSKAGS